jgi:hypothetical protein
MEIMSMSFESAHSQKMIVKRTKKLSAQENSLVVARMSSECGV